MAEFPRIEDNNYHIEAIAIDEVNFYYVCPCCSTDKPVIHLHGSHNDFRLRVVSGMITHCKKRDIPGDHYIYITDRTTNICHVKREPVKYIIRELL